MLSQPEIKYFCVAVVPDHDVLRFDVAMYYARGMRCRKRISYLKGNIDRLRICQLVSSYLFTQSGTRYMFVNDTYFTIRIYYFVNRDNVRVIKYGGGLSLELKAAKTIGVICNFRPKDLYCDIAVELGVMRSINLTHSSGPDLFADLISINFSAQSHCFDLHQPQRKPACISPACLLPMLE